jgi:hypothetical protein
VAGGQVIQIGERDKAIQAYYAELMSYEAQQVEHEMALRTAFQNLLAHYAHQVKWTLIPELTIANGARPDGVLRDKSLFYWGYWGAKDTHDDLDAEIAKKIARGYPTTNTIFEDTRRAVLFHNGRKTFEADLRVPRKLADLLQLFFGHEEAQVERFEQAVEVFRERIPDLARELQTLIASERQANATFRTAFLQAVPKQHRDELACSHEQDWFHWRAMGLYLSPLAASSALVGPVRMIGGLPWGILYALITGCRWQDLPREVGAPTTVWRRLLRK